MYSMYSYAATYTYYYLNTYYSKPLKDYAHLANMLENLKTE